MKQKIIFSHELEHDLSSCLSEKSYESIFVLTDITTKENCWPAISGFDCLKHAHLITIGPTDTNKNINSLTHVWQALDDKGATRHSCLINLGGGMVTDLGGFAAATFKRGIDFINIPTTLLAMVDAAVGGKTGINFNGLKNEIGAFSEATYVIIQTTFLQTLDKHNILSGYAEMLKHGLISDEQHWAELLRFEPINAGSSESPASKTEHLEQLQQMLKTSIKVKEDIVSKDPKENGLRRALNFGHTFGHAFESLSLQRSTETQQTGMFFRPAILHGYAVAYGIICELYLSATKLDFPTAKMRQTVDFIKNFYGNFPITCDDYREIIRLMKHDKKNVTGEINFTLLADIGDIRINQHATEAEMKEVLDFFREG